jgi:hypothetical protein
MSTISDILDRLSSVTALKERLVETNRNVDRSLAWLLEHEKRLIHLEAGVRPPPSQPVPRLPRK